MGATTQYAQLLQLQIELDTSTLIFSSMSSWHTACFLAWQWPLTKLCEDMALSKGVFQSQVEAVSFELFICTMSDRCQIWLCFSWKLKRCSPFGNCRSISFPQLGCELFDRQPDSLIHLHTHPSQSTRHIAGVSGWKQRSELFPILGSTFAL